MRGGREVSHQNAENYKSAIIDYLEARGYFPVEDSSEVSTTADLKFVEPSGEGGTKLWVEAKYTDLSSYDSTLLTELARYFIEYMNKTPSEKFDLYIFVRRCKNRQRWKHIFDTGLRKKDEVEDFREDMLEKADIKEEEREKIESYTKEDFENFLADCFVREVNYEGLKMKIDKLEEEGRFHVQEFYTREEVPLSGREELIGNFAEITHYPKYVYIAELEEGTDQRSIYSENPKYKPFWLHEGNIFSLFPLKNASDSLSKFVLEETQEKRDFQKWRNEDWKNARTARSLIKKKVCERGVEIACLFKDYKGYKLYFEHGNMEKERQKFRERLVSRCFKDTESPFVKHKAVNIEVKGYEDHDYVFLTPIILFSEDGKNLITGEQVRSLHEKFSPNKYEFNMKVKRDFLYWFNGVLGLSRSDPNGQSIMAEEPSSMELPVCPPEDTSERSILTKTKKLGEF